MSGKKDISNASLVNPHEGHRQRIKEKFLADGFSDATPPHEVLELLLCYSIPRKDTNELAHKLIERFGSISGVLDAEREEITAIPGITDNTYCLLKLILPIARIYLNDRSSAKNSIISRAEAVEYLKKQFLGVTNERVYMLCLDNKGRILGCPLLSEGNELSVSVSARVVMEHVIKTKATAVMIAHNHPKGFAFPSPGDVRVTSEIAAAISHINVRFLDHIVIADDDCVSMAASKEYSFIFSKK